MRKETKTKQKNPPVVFMLRSQCLGFPRLGCPCIYLFRLGCRLSTANQIWSNQANIVLLKYTRWVKFLVNNSQVVFSSSHIYFLLHINIYIPLSSDPYPSPLSSLRLLAVTSSHSVQGLGPASVSTSPWWWWNPSWQHCFPSTLYAPMGAWPWTASHRPTTSPSSLWSISRRPIISAWDSYRDREAAGKHSETLTFFFLQMHLHTTVIHDIYIYILSITSLSMIF